MTRSLAPSARSLLSARAVFILDSEGSRLIAKYYSDDYPTLKEQKPLETALFAKTKKGNDEVILFDSHVVVYRKSGDVYLYVVGYEDENELVLGYLLSALNESLNLALGQVDKQTIMQNYDQVVLVLDETVDNGIILDSNPHDIISRVTKHETGEVSDEALMTALRIAEEQFGMRPRDIFGRSGFLL
ncbi:Golgi-to-ER vesicle coat component [Borealophlyctis nickersoniae]|nr:Golgi-to-ER vesicle coat component [Borealophlyctis nickersoniae]